MSQHDSEPVVPRQIPQAGAGTGHPAVAFEASDLRWRPVAAVVVLLAAALAMLAASARLLLVNTDARYADRSRSSRPFAATKLPTEPRLDPLEPQFPTASSFEAIERDAEARLHRYGQASEPGFVHIPIEKAITILAKDLQSQQPAGNRNPKSLGLVGGGDANSGRLFRENSP